MREHEILGRAGRGLTTTFQASEVMETTNREAFARLSARVQLPHEVVASPRMGPNLAGDTLAGISEARKVIRAASGSSR
jgi:hypothetical protein